MTINRYQRKILLKQNFIELLRACHSNNIESYHKLKTSSIEKYNIVSMKYYNFMSNIYNNYTIFKSNTINNYNIIKLNINNYVNNSDILFCLTHNLCIINRLFQIFTIIIFEFFKYYFKNIIYKFKKLPTHERIELIKSIVKKIEKINIVYVKFIQSICIDKTFLTDNENNFLIDYTDKVPFDNKDIDYDVIDLLEKDYNITLDVMEPINSGVVSVVFKAKMNLDSNKVVIKILKKNIKNDIIKVHNDLLFISNIFKYIPYLNKINLYKIISDNKEILLDQLDFIKEVNNINNFRNKFINNEDFKIPYVYSEITKNYNNIIVMENIKGLTYSELQHYDENTKNIFGELILKFTLINVLYNNLIHCDLHAGNVFFYINNINGIKKYQVGIIDYGIILYPSKEKQNIYYKYFYEVLYRNDFTNLDYILFNIVNDPEQLKNMDFITKENFLNELKNIFIMINSDEEYNIKQMLNFISIYKKYNIDFNKDLNQIILSLQTSAVLANNLCSNLVETQNNIIKNFTKINDVLKID